MRNKETFFNHSNTTNTSVVLFYSDNCDNREDLLTESITLIRNTLI